MKTVVDFPDRKTVEAEACAWIAQLDGDEPPSSEDVAALREWINRSPLHRAEMERLSELWGDINILTELAIPLDKPQESQPGGIFDRLFAPLFTPRRMAAVAGVLLIGFAAVFGFRLLDEGRVPAHLAYSTEVGEQHLATLPDGSTIELNTDTQVEVDYDRDERKIRLLRGEAHFNVAHNPDKPFVVYAGTGLVRAVGTAFSVYLRDGDVEVTVTEGRVELASVTNTDGNRGSTDIQFTEPVSELGELEAGQSATFDGEINSILSIEKMELARKLSWRDGMLVFSGESLEYVVEEVSRYTPISIEFSDPALRDLRIGGYFKVGETEALFEVLETNFGVEVSRVSDDIVRFSSPDR